MKITFLPLKLLALQRLILGSLSWLTFSVLECRAGPAGVAATPQRTRKCVPPRRTGGHGGSQAPPAARGLNPRPGATAGPLA